jgi:hypothetical protein
MFSDDIATKYLFLLVHHLFVALYFRTRLLYLNLHSSDAERKLNLFLQDFVPVELVREEMRKIRELVELPLRNPELFRAIGVKLPGVNSTPDIASLLFPEVQQPHTRTRSLLRIDRRPKKTCREMLPRHHRAKRDLRLQWQRSE